MDLKKLAIKGTMIASAATVIGGIAILNYDQHNFYQEDLDDAYCRIHYTERFIADEYKIIDKAAYSEVKTYPIWQELDSLYDLQNQRPENSWHFEGKIDSLWNKIDSLRDDIAQKRIENNQDLQNAHTKLDSLYKRAEKLTQDSIINDSINNQPWGQRFKNNWNKIFCLQKQY